MSSPVAGLDRTDCKILTRLNRGSETPSPTTRNRISRLLDSGYVEKNNFGEVAITLRGQLELARWRYRKLPKIRFSIMGYIPSKALFAKFFHSP